MLVEWGVHTTYIVDEHADGNAEKSTQDVSKHSIWEIDDSVYQAEDESAKEDGEQQVYRSCRGRDHFGSEFGPGGYCLRCGCGCHGGEGWAARAVPGRAGAVGGRGTYRAASLRACRASRVAAETNGAVGGRGAHGAVCGRGAAGPGGGGGAGGGLQV